MGWVDEVVSLDGEYGRRHTQDGSPQARQPLGSEVLKHDRSRKHLPVRGELRRVARLDVDSIRYVDLDESQVRWRQSWVDMNQDFDRDRIWSTAAHPWIAQAHLSRNGQPVISADRSGGAPSIALSSRRRGPSRGGIERSNPIV